VNARRVAASLFRRIADRLDPPPKPERFEPGEQMRAADALCREIELVRALRASLRRYSPEEKPGEA
jgi:hypothetical protein